MVCPGLVSFIGLGPHSLLPFREDDDGEATILKLDTLRRIVTEPAT